MAAWSDYLIVFNVDLERVTMENKIKLILGNNDVREQIFGTDASDMIRCFFHRATGNWIRLTFTMAVNVKDCSEQS